MSGVVDTLVCPKISLPSPNVTWDDLAAFEGALEMPLHYLRGPQESFLPGRVQVGWSGDFLYVLATLTDAEVYTDAKADRDYMWALGDVFEIFMRDQATEEYFELHTSPGAHRLQLGFANPQVILNLRDEKGTLEDQMLPGDMLVSQTRLTADGWQALCRVAWPITPMAGRSALISLSRYDYTRGQEEPVLSSTSQHEIVNYHRQEDWTPVVFAA